MALDMVNFGVTTQGLMTLTWAQTMERPVGGVTTLFGVIVMCIHQAGTMISVDFDPCFPSLTTAQTIQCPPLLQMSSFLAIDHISTIDNPDNGHKNPLYQEQQPPSQEIQDHRENNVHYNDEFVVTPGPITVSLVVLVPLRIPPLPPGHSANWGSLWWIPDNIVVDYEVGRLHDCCGIMRVEGKGGDRGCLRVRAGAEGSGSDLIYCPRCVCIDVWLRLENESSSDGRLIARVLFCFALFLSLNFVGRSYLSGC